MTSREPMVDGLRAVAVLTVLLYHAVFATPVLWDDLFPAALRLDIGVPIFFLLSGYLIYGPFARSHIAGRSSPDLGRYAVRRVARIYPAYLVALGVLLALGWTEIHGFGRLVEHVTLTHGYFPSTETAFSAAPGISQSWTLVVEVSFYLFVPGWAWLVRRAAVNRDPVTVELAGVGVVLTVGTVAMVLAPYGHLPVVLEVMPKFLPFLGAGMLLTVLGAARKDMSRVPPALPCWIAAVGALGVLTLLVDEIDDSPRALLLHQTLNLTAAVLLVAPIVLRPEATGPVQTVLSWPAVRWIGVISYGVYLWHLDVLIDLPWGQPATTAVGALAGLAFTIPVCLAAGAASYYLVERPLMARAGRLGRRRRVAERPVQVDVTVVAPAGQLQVDLSSGGSRSTR